MQEIDLREGTLVLRVHELLNRRSSTLFLAKSRDGKLAVKKKGRKLVVIHELKRKPTRVELDLNEIDPYEIDELAITWNVFTRKFCLYINGELFLETELSYSELPSYIM